MRILAREQVAERRDGTVLDELRHLFPVAADREVADRPRRLLLRLELALAQILDDLRQQAGIDDGLHLGLVAGRDVRQEPDRLLADLVLGVAQQRREVRKGVAVQDDLEKWLKIEISRGHYQQRKVT